MKRVIKDTFDGASGCVSSDGEKGVLSGTLAGDEDRFSEGILDDCFVGATVLGIVTAVSLGDATTTGLEGINLGGEGTNDCAAENAGASERAF